MRLKSFYGANMTEALSLIRTTLGEDAIIVATRDEEGGGIRVTAALDDTPKVEEAIATEAAENTHADIIETIATALLRHAVPNNLAEKILATATQVGGDDPRAALEAALATHISFKPFTFHERSLLFVGPPGAGKTLCVAKSATQAKLQKKNVAVLSADMERAGGLEQLAAFTRLLDISLIEIEDVPALRDAVDMQPAGTLTFIDTPGRNVFIGEERDQIISFVKNCSGEAVLVLPADIDPMEAIDRAEAYHKLGITRLLPTKMDMTRRIGGILRTSYESKLPLCTFSMSSKVTDPLINLTPAILTHFILPEDGAARAPHAV